MWGEISTNQVINYSRGLLFVQRADTDNDLKIDVRKIEEYATPSVEYSLARRELLHKYA